MSLWDFGRSPQATSQALLLAEALRLGPTGLPTPSSLPFGTFFGVYGVGLIFQQGIVSPVVVMDVKHVGKPFEAVPLTSVPMAKNALDTVFPGEAENWAANVFALGINPPELHISPADDLLAPNLGTCGAGVHWDHSHGVLTAGHVGSALAAAAYSKGVHVGGVVFSCNPANAGAQVGADVALIELNPGVPLVTTITGTTQVQPLGSLFVLKRGQQSPVAVLGKLEWLTLPSANGTYGDVYLTANSVTQAGDSGAAVLLQGTTQVVGHVIGGTPGMSSFIQDITYQLRAIHAHPAFASVTV